MKQARMVAVAKAIAGVATSCLLMGLVAGCGGGGDDEEPMAFPTTPPADIVAAASQGNVHAKYDAGSGQFELHWDDRLSDETGYVVQREDGGTWKELASLPAQAATGSMGWSGTAMPGAKFRVALRARGFDVPLSGEMAVPAAVPQLTIDEGSTVGGRITIHFTPPPTGSVAYEISRKGSVLSPITDGVLRLDTGSIPNGLQEFVGKVTYAGTLEVVSKTSVTISNPSGSVQVATDVPKYIGPYTTTVPVLIRDDVLHQPPAKVEVWVAGRSIGALLAPNDCWTAPNCRTVDGLYQYHFNFDNRQIDVVDVQEIRVVATDVNGVVTLAESDQWFGHPAPVTLTSPADGIEASGTLRVQGTVAGWPSPLTVRVELWTPPTPNAPGTLKREFKTETIHANSATLDYTFDLVGVEPGSYVLKVTSYSDLITGAWTVERTIVVR